MEEAGEASGRPNVGRASLVAASSFMALVVVALIVGHDEKRRVDLAGEVGKWSEGLVSEGHGIVEDGGREGDKTLQDFRDGLGSGIREDEEARRIIGGAAGAVGTWWRIGGSGGSQQAEKRESDR
eukprot:753314-Hanusia_phi.AAC.1